MASVSCPSPAACQSPHPSRGRSAATLATLLPPRVLPQASRALRQNPTGELAQVHARRAVNAPSPSCIQSEPPTRRHAASARISQSSGSPPTLASASAGTRCTLPPCAVAPGRAGTHSGSDIMGKEEEDEEEEEEGEEEEGDEGEEPVMSRARARRLEKTRQKREERQREQDLLFQEFSRCAPLASRRGPPAQMTASPLCTAFPHCQRKRFPSHLEFQSVKCPGGHLGQRYRSLFLNSFLGLRVAPFPAVRTAETWPVGTRSSWTCWRTLVSDPPTQRSSQPRSRVLSPLPHRRGHPYLLGATHLPPFRRDDISWCPTSGARIPAHYLYLAGRGLSSRWALAMR